MLVSDPTDPWAFSAAFSSCCLTCVNKPLHQPVYGHHAQHLAELLMEGPVLPLAVLTAVIHVQTPAVIYIQTSYLLPKDQHSGSFSDTQPDTSEIFARIKPVKAINA